MIAPFWVISIISQLSVANIHEKTSMDLDRYESMEASTGKRMR